jgi:N-glycosylase/DNA lyase
MASILTQLAGLKASPVGKTVNARLLEFKKLGQSSEENIFLELCFCLLTANYSAEGGIRIQKAIGKGFLTLSEKEMAAELKKHGYRFPNTRAIRLVRAREHLGKIKPALASFQDEKQLRQWLVANVYGFGYKESSHFLRNIGYESLAIVDFHIVDLLERCTLAERPKTITPKKYLELEHCLEKLGRKAGMSMAELDLYLWYIETGKVLK